MPNISVVVADDHPVVLAGIKALLGEAPGVELVGEATSGADARSIILVKKPDVAVVDVSMPGMTGIELTRLITADCPDVKVLVLTVHEDRAYVQRLLQAGARGYLLKRSAAEDLLRAIRAVGDGGVYLDPAIAEKAFEASTSDQLPAGQDDLSPRETDVLRLTARGFSNKEIAGHIDVSVKTVETYKARALEKLQMRTRAEIVRYGSIRGWLDQFDD